MKFIPHDYQAYAIDFMCEHPVSALLLDMGLGKTVSTLTAIDLLINEYFEVNRVLVIAPLRVARTTWPDEVKKWDHLSGISISVACGDEEDRIHALEEDSDICTINRENIKWLFDMVKSKRVAFKWDMIVIDELSSFKNPQAERTKCLLKMRPKATRVVGLTGTPASNGLMDLFSEFKVLDMGERLGRYITAYRAAYFRPDRMNGSITYTYKLTEGSEDRIYDRIRDITVSMKATDHLDMPDLIMSNVEVSMDEKEREHYDRLKTELCDTISGQEITVLNAASLSGKLTQMANGAVYSDTKEVIPIHEHKLDALEDLIESSCGKPVLVAYWYKHDLVRIKERLDKLKVKYATIDSDRTIRDWNLGRIPVGLIHPASAGHGLNLQEGSDHIIWFGLTWSLELYQQTNARLYRQGQMSRTVTVQHIVTRETVDERILRALNDKDMTQSAMMDAVKAELMIS